MNEYTVTINDMRIIGREGTSFILRARNDRAAKRIFNAIDPMYGGEISLSRWYLGCGVIEVDKRKGRYERDGK